MKIKLGSKNKDWGVVYFVAAEQSGPESFAILGFAIFPCSLWEVSLLAFGYRGVSSACFVPLGRGGFTVAGVLASLGPW